MRLVPRDAVVGALASLALGLACIPAASASNASGVSGVIGGTPWASAITISTPGARPATAATGPGATPISTGSPQAAGPEGPPVAEAATWHQVFSDQFSGPALDTSRWATCYPWFDESDVPGCTNYGNREQEWYQSGQSRVRSHTLNLVAERAPTPGQSSLGTPETYPWRSGMATTYPSLSLRYGFVQVRARIPSGAGLWPAIWLLPRSLSWPPEIDVMEAYGADTSAAYVTAVFSATAGTRSQFRREIHTANLASGYHVYGVDWEPGSLTWYIDGRLVASVRNPGVSSTPMFLILNLAVSSAPGYGPTLSTPAQSSFDIRDVTVWQHR